MATTNYNLPTINGTDTVDGVNAINGLANSVDATLKNIAETIPDKAEIATEIAAAQTSADTAINTANAATATANNANTTAASAQAQATSAQTTANTALQVANTLDAVITEEPKNILFSYVPEYVFDPTQLKAVAWGHIGVIEVKGVRVATSEAVVIGKVAEGYEPTYDITVPSTTWGGTVATSSFLQLKTTGEIVVHSFLPEGISSAEPVGQLVWLDAKPF